MPRHVTIAAVSAGLEASVASRAMKVEENVQRALSCIDRVAPCRADVIVLTEGFHAAGVPGRYDELALLADGEIVRSISDRAKALKCHIVCPIYERRGDYVFNTALWINRKGEISGRYDKIQPTESEIDSGVTSGLTEPTIWETDFGKVGCQICFDLNWPEGWFDLKRAGAELIVWPSAYAGGRPLSAMAFMTRRFVVSATWPRKCRVFDISGDVIESCGRLADFIIATIDLERRLFHWDYQGDRLDRIRNTYGRDVQIDIYHEEGWFALNSLRDDLTVDQLIREFELVTIDDYYVRTAARQAEHRPTRPIEP